MNETDNPTLVAVAEAVTDGVPVDWVGLKARHPALSQELAAMETMAEVVTAYRIVRDAAAAPEA